MKTWLNEFFGLDGNENGKKIKVSRKHKKWIVLFLLFYFEKSRDLLLLHVSLIKINKFYV